MSKIIGSKISGLGEWDTRYMELAELVSTWSKDIDHQVGAVVVVERYGAIALGYNGFPERIRDDNRLKDKDTKNRIILHAEENALRMAGDARTKEATLYVYGKPICRTCAREIVQAGISRIVCMNPEDESSEEWRSLGREAKAMFEEAHIDLTYFKIQNKG